MTECSLKSIICLLAVCALMSGGNQAAAAEYALSANTSVVGKSKTLRTDYDDTLLEIGKIHGFGFQDIKLANPGVDTFVPGEGREVILPSEFVLPNAPRVGIVINIPEMRLYHYPDATPGKEPSVITYPLGIGREGWHTPYIKTRIVRKQKDPAWYPPESIRREHEENGDPLPKMVPPGPDNPMGAYALRLGVDTYSIHGTNKPFGMGMRVSHGCIRLYPNDIEDLFDMVKVNTPVNIINQPYKIGVRDGIIYLEVHPSLDEDREYYSRNNLTEVVKNVIEVMEHDLYTIDWSMVRKVLAEATGIPVAVGTVLSAAPAGAAVADGSASNQPAGSGTKSGGDSIKLIKTRPAPARTK